jgi:hypothetical protein
MTTPGARQKLQRLFRKVRAMAESSALAGGFYFVEKNGRFEVTLFEALK